MLALWQTRMLRLEKLGVLDEVANGLSYFEQTFLPEVPRLYSALEDELRAAPGRAARRSCPRSCGSARGSAATATATRSSPPPCSAQTLRLQSSKVFAHYLEQLHALGAELSITTLVATRRRNSRPWPTARPTRARTGATSRIAGR